MRTILLSIIAVVLPVVASQAAEKAPSPVASQRASGLSVAEDWPWWRGPGRNGVASPEQDPPLRWSESENVKWKSEIPGKGHGTPIVVGEHVLLATADEDRGEQSVLCYDRRTGKRLWQTVVHHGGVEVKGNKKASRASSSLACDGERLYINFLNSGAVYTTALSRDGRKLWQTKVTDYVLHQGYGSSPAVYGGLVLVSADNKGGGAVAALDSETGEIVWRRERPKTPNYASPILLHVAGRDQLLLTGCNLVTSLDPKTGEVIWEIDGATTECVTSTVADGDLVFTSGGYPKNHMSAVRADGSGEIVWENNTRVYVPSILAKDGYLYASTDAGVASCWEAATGKVVWKGRLGGTFTASPVLVGERIYAINESGEAFVFKASPEEFELLAESKLGDEVYATPVVVGGELFLRVAEKKNGTRQEMLYCISEQ